MSSVVRFKLKYSRYEVFKLVFLTHGDYWIYDREIRPVLKRWQIEHMVLYEDYEQLSKLNPLPQEIYYSPNVALEEIERRIPHHINIPLTPWAKIQDWESEPQSILPKIQEKSSESPCQLVASISWADLPAAAGNARDFTGLPEETLEKFELPSETSIVSERREGGYAIYIQGNIAMKLLIVFKKGQEVLYKKEICNLVPTEEELIPSEKIKNFTEIQLLKIIPEKDK